MAKRKVTAVKKKPAAKKKAVTKKPVVKRGAGKKTKKKAVSNPPPAMRRPFTKPPPQKSAKSGYAADILPERVDGDEAKGLAVGRSGGKGHNTGRELPGDRAYQAQYGVATLAEASANLSARSSGQMDVIEGGLDVSHTERSPNDGTTDYPNDPIASDPVDPNAPVEGPWDPLGGEEQFEPGSPQLLADEQSAIRKHAQAPVAVTPRAPEPVEEEYEEEEDGYLDQRCRVTLELVDGAMAMTAIDVKETAYGLTILLPIAGDGATFIPKPGSAITVVKGEQRWPCFFPGTYFEVEELGFMCLVFVKEG